MTLVLPGSHARERASILRSRASGVALCFVLCACRRDTAPPQATDAPAASLATPTVTAPTARPSPFDAQGHLKASGLKIDWFEIPAGFENAGSRPQHHLFVSHEVKLDQLREYLAPRMLTGRVDQLGEGAIYRE